MTSRPAKFLATAALAGAIVLGGAAGAFAQDNGSGNGSGTPDNGSGNGSGNETTTTTMATGGDTGGSGGVGTALPLTGGEAALTLGGAGALAGLAYAARRAAQARV